MIVLLCHKMDRGSDNFGWCDCLISFKLWEFGLILNHWLLTLTFLIWKTDAHRMWWAIAAATQGKLTTVVHPKRRAFPMILRPVASSVLESSHFATLDDSGRAIISIGIRNIAVSQIRWLRAEPWVAESCLPSVFSANLLLNLEIGRLKRWLLEWVSRNRWL